jgi:hypothetical protein
LLLFLGIVCELLLPFLNDLSMTRLLLFVKKRVEFHHFSLIFEVA